MGIWNALFGGRQLSPEEEQKEQEAKKYDLLKYDGVKAMKIGQTDYAIRCFQEALKLNHSDLEVHDYLSQVLLRKGDLDGALEQLQSLLANFTGDKGPILERIAQIAYMKEDYARMKDICERALKVDDKNSRVHYQYAQALNGQGDRVKALARLSKAISLNENDADARLLRGQTLYAMKQYAGAVEDVRWLLEHVQPQEDVLLLGARVMHAGKNDEVALRLYDAIIEINPFHVDAYRERGKIRFDRGDKAGAEEDMKKVLEINPEELSGVSGDFKAEGVEEQVKRAYSMMNPFGI
jgi:tetratricopeptide (TPR) repeat protein